MRPWLWLQSRPALRDAGIYTVGNALPQAVNVALLPVFTRVLVPEEYGILAYITALGVLMGVLSNLSIHSFVLRRWFETPGERRPELLGTIGLYLAVHNAALVIVGLAFLPGALEALGVHVPAVYVRAIVVLTALESAAVLPLVYYRVQQRAGRFVILASTQVLIGSALSIYFMVFRQHGVAGRYEGLLISQGLMALVYIAILVRYSRLSADRSVIKAGLAFSLPLVPAALLLNVAVAFDRIILERFVSLADVGIYGIALAVAGGLALITNGIYKAVEPDIYRAADAPGFHERLLRAKNYIILGLLGFAIPLVGGAHELLALLASPAYAGAGALIAPLAVALVLRGAAVVPSCYLMARYKTRWEMAVTVGGAVATIGLDIILVPILGPVGAALGAIGAATAVLTGYVLVTRSLGMRRWGFLRDAVTIAAACGYAYVVSCISLGGVVLTVSVKCLLLSVPLALIIARLRRETSVAIDSGQTAVFLP